MSGPHVIFRENKRRSKEAQLRLPKLVKTSKVKECLSAHQNGRIKKFKKSSRPLNTGHAAFPHDSEPYPAVPLTNHRQEFGVYTKGQPETKTKADAIKEE